MTLVDSLKNIIHRDRDRQGGNTDSSSASRQAKSSHSPSSSTSSSRQHRGSNPPDMQPAPSSAQNATYAAFQPEPATRSEARVFGAANPAHDNPPKSVSPGLHQGHASPGDAREQAERSGSQFPLAFKAVELTSFPFSGTCRTNSKVAYAQVRRSTTPVRAARQNGRVRLHSDMTSCRAAQSLLNSGAFSNVYKAYDRVAKRKVAIKCVRKYELNSSQVRRIVPLPSVRVPSSLREPARIHIPSPPTPYWLALS